MRRLSFSKGTLAYSVAFANRTTTGLPGRLELQLSTEQKIYESQTSEQIVVFSISIKWATSEFHSLNRTRERDISNDDDDVGAQVFYFSHKMHNSQSVHHPPARPIQGRAK